MTLAGPGASEFSVEDVSATIAGIELGPAAPVEAAAGPASTSIVLAVETSSGTLFGLIEQAQAAALGILDGLGPNDRVAVVAVVAFGDEAEVVSDLTTDRAVTRSAIESLTLGSFAGVYAGVDTAAGLLAPPASGGRRSSYSAGAGTSAGSARSGARRARPPRRSRVRRSSGSRSAQTSMVRTSAT